MTFDTLKFVEKLEASGFTHGQAKVIAEALVVVASDRLATKVDLKEIIGSLETDVRLLKWMTGLVLVFQVLICGKLFLH